MAGRRVRRTSFYGQRTAGYWLAPPAPVEAPRAPPLPFRFMGQLDDGRGNQTYFLARGTAMLSVSLGETIDSTYVLERVELGALHFTYLPLRERQSLQFGAGP